MVAANSGDVLEPHDGPEAALVLERVEGAEVQRLTAELFEDLVRGAVTPEVEVAQVQPGQVGGSDRGHGATVTPYATDCDCLCASAPPRRTTVAARERSGAVQP